MIEASRCVLCEGEIKQIQRALVAPFLATRIWNRAPFCVNLVQCETCDFMFYNPRLEPSEEQRLYAGYRDSEYQRMRHASEPWYTVRVNASLASVSSYKRRQQALRAVLRSHAGDRHIRSVLDYGGDRGDLVCGLVEDATAFVYDISGIEPAAGVISTTDPAGCKPDLIISSNVLEHVGSPRNVVSEMCAAAPPNSMLFIEVPRESPFAKKRIFRRIAQVGLMVLVRPALIRSVIRPESLFMMHEHINYFSERSLTALIGACGCELVAAGAYVIEGPLEKGEMAWCLAKPRKTAP